MDYELSPEAAERLQRIFRQDGYLRPTKKGARELFGSFYGDTEAGGYVLTGPRKRRPGPKSTSRKER